MNLSRSENLLSLMAALALLGACGGESSSAVTDQSSMADTDDTVAVEAPPTEEATPVEETAAAEEVTPVEETAEAEPAPPAFPTSALIDPNTASIDELAAVPRMNPAAAAEIVNGRPFKSQSKLDAAIGDALDDEARKSVYAHAFIKVGLNSGAEKDYKLIPSSMSAGKLAHEFEEYRPYESMEEFSREMSKYVSDEEVAYLARFVTLD